MSFGQLRNEIFVFLGSLQCISTVNCSTRRVLTGYRSTVILTLHTSQTHFKTPIGESIVSWPSEAMSIHDSAYESYEASHALLEFASCWGLRLFLLLVSLVSLRNAPQLFLSSHGRSHRLVGGLLFVWIILGVCTCGIDAHLSGHYVLLYDIVLGCLGTATTLTAARDFPHRLVKNEEYNE